MLYNDFVKMLENAKIPFSTTEDNAKLTYYRYKFPTTMKMIQVTNSSNFGYSDAMSVWLFDKDNNFLNVSHWE